MSNKEAARLIIENLPMLEEAKNLLDGEICLNFMNTVDELIKNNISELFDDSWIGDFDSYNGKYWAWFIPPAWMIGEEVSSKKAYATYGLNFIDKSESAVDNWWLSSFFPSGYARVGFSFWVNNDKFDLKPKLKTWQSFATKKNEDNSEIAKIGFEFDPKKGDWFLPFELKTEEVAEGFTNDNLVDALTPIIDALKKLHEAHPHFVKIVEDAKKVFGGLALEDESETPNAIEQ